ncbi:TRAP transporter large permease [Roseomonas genomospecies 6]|uniref:TRAP transporter large permease protein n=1 Tax=Roseomonas genomospecies 6 TaxID=214106 RepID=A0A9W7TZ28_9PROT|nr:TRAP transporter large permease [Roseomonas genomospecies 6]KAA0680722.1 TRAP transporter large permease [Roseomonas genomospecies 6]
MDLSPAFVLSAAFVALLAFGVPISYATGLASITALLTIMPPLPAITVTAQRIATGLDSFALLAIPFFFMAGSIMNRGGIARRLIDCAKVFVGWMPGPLAQITILANMMFGCVSGSAVAAASAIGGTMQPSMDKAGYDRSYTAAVNISSCITGLLIPPSGAFIVYSLVSGGTSIAALFVAGYLPGLLLGLAVMIPAWMMAKKRGYARLPSPTLSESSRAVLSALPSLGLILVVIGGIVGGVFTATEGSAIAVVYALALALAYRELSMDDIGQILVDTIVATSVVALMVGTSMAMAYVMSLAEIPQIIGDWVQSAAGNWIIALLLVNIVLLLMGTFLDITPGILIFTPIFLPVLAELGVDPVHFGVILVFNLCLGIVSPPTGSALFIGCAVARVSIEQVIRPLIPLFAWSTAALLVVTYVPGLSLWLPRLFGLIK